MEKQEVIKALLPAFTAKAGRMGFETGENPHDYSSLAAFHKGGGYVFSLMPDGSIRFKPDTPYHSEVMDLADTLMEMKEAYGIFLNAESVPVEGVSKFRMLAEYGNFLMAARMGSDQHLHFVTWEYDYDHSGVMWGHYYGDNYAGVKQDFAVRAGLISESKLFNEEELVVLHDACAFRGKNDEEISFDDEKKLQSVMDKVEQNIPGLIFNSREQENEHEAESGMEV